MKRLYNFLLPLLFCAPDGAGGGSASPGEIPLEGWIKRLNEAEKKNRNTVVGELAKALGIKTGEAYKKLKEAGRDPKNAPPPPPVKTFSVTLRHKTPYPGYRRAGIVLTNQFKPYTVTAAQLAALKTDTWVEVQETGEPDKK
ncbi:MAG: hypothetical protein LBK08_04075 [Treponema sp.]|jgi:hypothetical protein|nr:hypothetical protein [Treponema sp.]